MIVGVVRATREAVVPLELRPPGRAPLNIDAVVDTGFSGFLSLPSSLVRELGIRRSGSTVATLGDGSSVLLPLFRVVVAWDGQTRRVEVLASDGGALIGMGLLDGFDLHIQVGIGGRVSIRRSDRSRG